MAGAIEGNEEAVSNDLFAAAKERIQREMAEASIPSLGVAVARNGKILWEEAFGLADRDKQIPATADTMYSLASVSKPITATGIMVLVDQGKIDLDAPVNQYLARDSQLKVWIGDPEEVTVRRVANHTSGLPGQCNFYNADEIASMPTMEESIRHYGNVVTIPGERYRYSNFGYGVLDHLIARVSGKSYADFLRSEVFLPLGMTRSSVDIAPDLQEFAAPRYDDEDNVIPFYSCDHAGASSVYASMHDLVRFGMFHLGQIAPGQQAIMSEESRAAMHVPTASMSPVNLNDFNLALKSHYGVGWVIDDDDLGLRVSHGGGMGGVASKISMLPNEGIVVVAASNKFCPLPWTIEREILSALVPGYAAKSDEHWKMREELQAGRETPPAFKPVPELLGDWEGAVHTYAGDFSMTLSFKESGDIHAKLEEQLPVLVVGARFQDGLLTGKMSGRLDTPDVRRRSWQPQHHLALDLKLRGDVINGTVVTVSGNMLSHWVELRKKPDA